MRVDATRATSGLLEPVPDEDDDSDAGDFLAGVGQRLEDALQGHVQQEIDALETVQLSRELMQRWPNEYQQMDERIDKLQQQVEELKTSYEKIRSNPLRPWRGLSKSSSRSPCCITHPRNYEPRRTAWRSK